MGRVRRRRCQHCSEGCYVKVQGQISKYQGKFQITLTKMRSAADSEVDTADFVPTTQFDIAEMDAELRGYVDGFQQPAPARLVLAFLDDPSRSAPRFATLRRPSGCTMPGLAACWSMC